MLLDTNIVSAFIRRDGHELATSEVGLAEGL
jgi:hypothetical protein